MVIRRRKMRFVDVWSDGEPGAADSRFRFMLLTRPVHTLYTLGLRAAPEAINATTAWLRIVVESQDEVDEWSTNPDHIGISPSAYVPVEQPNDGYGFSDAIFTTIDDRAMATTGRERSLLILEWLHSLMLGIAEVRKWPTAPLVSARDYCLDRQCQFEIVSPAKSSPDRRHKATLTFSFDDEGRSVLRPRIVDRSSAEVAHTEIQAFVDIQEWPGVRNSLRWVSETAVEFGALLTSYEFDVRQRLTSQEFDVSQYLDLGESEALYPEHGNDPEPQGFGSV